MIKYDFVTNAGSDEDGNAGADDGGNVDGGDSSNDSTVIPTPDRSALPDNVDTAAGDSVVEAAEFADTVLLYFSFPFLDIRKNAEKLCMISFARFPEAENLIY